MTSSPRTPPRPRTLPPRQHRDPGPERLGRPRRAPVYTPESAKEAYSRFRGLKYGITGEKDFNDRYQGKKLGEHGETARLVPVLNDHENLDNPQAYRGRRKMLDIERRLNAARPGVHSRESWSVRERERLAGLGKNPHEHPSEVDDVERIDGAVPLGSGE